jgi:hypothetical protein
MWFFQCPWPPTPLLVNINSRCIIVFIIGNALAINKLTKLSAGMLELLTPYQGCKLLSDIGQCPTKFGKCPSKSNFDRSLVRSQKKIVTLYIFLLWQNPIANSLNLHFAIKFARHSRILLNVAPEWLYILVSWLIYILWRIYISDQI